ncbi:hypothetical protein [Kribbella pittospori]|uniref:hypothetical protein n=1 Tax=Kribbella pittospori TaxID=722689 RepID=UPI0013F457F9|nr:hypothetical protein [Kribbella pittospori]
MSNSFFRSDNLRRSGRFVARFAHQLSVESGTTVSARWNPVSPAPNSRSRWQIA